MLDSHRVARHTTWTKEKGPDLGFVTPNLDTNALESENSIDLIFTAAMWQYRPPHVHIGIYNSHPQGEPVTFDI